MKSFTLIELIVVIAIIAILAAIIAPNAFKAIQKAKISQMVSDFRTIKTATLSFYADTGQWPASDICHSQGGGGIITVETQDFITGENQPVGWDGPYLEKWPRTPFKPEGGGYVHDYYNFINAPTTGGGVCVAVAGDDVYLQVGSVTSDVADTVKMMFDGHAFRSTNIHSQTGVIRYTPSRLLMYYVIAIAPECQ